MIDIENLIKKLYGERDSHEEYFVIYKNIANSENIIDKIHFINVVNNYFKKNCGCDNYFMDTHLSGEISEYINWFCEDFCVDFIIKNNMYLLANNFLIHCKQKNESKIIKFLFNDERNFDFLIEFSNYFDDDNLLYISNQFIEYDKMEKLLIFTEKNHVNIDNCVQYLKNKIINNAIDSSDKMLLLVSFVNSFYEDGLTFELSNCICECFSSKLLYEFLIEYNYFDEFYFKLLKKLLNDGELEYVKNVASNTKNICELKEENLDFIMTCNSLELMILFYKNNSLWNFRKKQIKINLLMKILNSNDKNYVYENLICNYKFITKEEKNHVFSFCEENSYYDNIINCFTSYSLNKKLHFDLYNSIIKNSRSEDLMIKLNELLYDDSKEHLLLFLYEIIEESTLVFKFESEHEADINDLSNYKKSLEVLSCVKNLVFSNKNKFEDNDEYAEKFFEEYSKYLVDEKNEEIINDSPFKKIRKKIDCILLK